jgi:hypothetical protein
VITKRSGNEVVGKELCVCEGEYANISANIMGGAILSVQMRSLKWVIGLDPSGLLPVEPPTMMMKMAASCYVHNAPLTVYTNLAVIEAIQHATNSNFWRNFYKSLEAVYGHYTTPGMMYNNIFLLMGDPVRDNNCANIASRKPSIYTGMLNGKSHLSQFSKVRATQDDHWPCQSRM